MKNSSTFALLSALVLGIASQPLLAAASKGEVRAAALAAALTAVSPDPLGGQIGLTVATARVAERAPSSRVTALRSSGDLSRRAYANWKGSTR